MVNVSDHYGIDSRNLLNVVYDKSKDILYVGSKDKGIYEVRLNKMIDYKLFKEKSIIDLKFLIIKKSFCTIKGSLFSMLLILF